jgi:hypothetical protein
MICQNEWIESTCVHTSTITEDSTAHICNFNYSSQFITDHGERTILTSGIYDPANKRKELRMGWFDRANPLDIRVRIARLSHANYRQHCNLCPFVEDLT